MGYFINTKYDKVELYGKKSDPPDKKTFPVPNSNRYLEDPMTIMSDLPWIDCRRQDQGGVIGHVNSAYGTAKLSYYYNDYTHRFEFKVLAINGSKCDTQFFGKGCPYSSCLAGALCFIAGVDETKGALMELLDGRDVEMSQEERERQARIQANNKAAAKQQAIEADRNRKIAMDYNIAAINKLNFGNNGQNYDPRVIDALATRGFDYRLVAPEKMHRFAFADNLYLKAMSGDSMNSITGLAIRLDDDNENSPSWQIRRMVQGNYDRTTGTKTFRFWSHGDEDKAKEEGHTVPRFKNVGKANLFGMNDILRYYAANPGDPRRFPIFIAEGPFDALAFDTAAMSSELGRCGWGVSLQGCQNTTYLKSALEQVKRLNLPIVVAMDTDAPGRSAASVLKKELEEAGVVYYRLPGIMGKTDMDMNDLYSKYPLGAESLVRLMSKVITMANTGRLNAAIVQRMFGNSANILELTPSSTPDECARAAIAGIEKTCNPLLIQYLEERYNQVINGEREIQNRKVKPFNRSGMDRC